MIGKNNAKRRWMKSNQGHSTTGSTSAVVDGAVSDVAEFSGDSIVQTILLDLRQAAHSAIGINPNSLPPLRFLVDEQDGVVGVFNGIAGLNPNLDGFTSNPSTGVLTYVMVLQSSPNTLVLRWFPGHLAARAYKAGKRGCSVKKREARFASVSRDVANFYWAAGGPQGTVVAM